MARERRSGILLHPTSLPGAHGIGDLGPAAIRFLDWLERARQRLWQVLPLGPAGPGHSPYSSASAFAGNPLLISPERLVESDLLPESALEVTPRSDATTVSFTAVAEWKEAVLRLAWGHARSRSAGNGIVAEVRELGERPEFGGWLEDWTLYAALERRFGGAAWQSWPAELRDREAGAMERARRDLAKEIDFHAFTQLVFGRQWDAVRTAARARGVRIVGDLPIYVAAGSADTWSRRELFELGAEGRPTGLAGVPPDAFSEDGQAWGNPLYRWDRIAGEGYRWWVERLRAGLRRADLLRLDHFRGYVGYWKIPVGAPSARDGVWTPAPGPALFAAARQALGHLPLVAEDLGTITPDVRRLRRELGIPCTRVLQFGFDDPASEHLPHNLEPDTFYYTGTHDNDTAAGWLDALPAETRDRVAEYVDGEPSELAWSLIRAALGSVATDVVLPLQDVLGLGSEARMNRPSVAEGNWRWRAPALPGEAATARLARLTELTGRAAAGEGAEDLER